MTSQCHTQRLLMGGPSVRRLIAAATIGFAICVTGCGNNAESVDEPVSPSTSASQETTTSSSSSTTMTSTDERPTSETSEATPEPPTQDLAPAAAEPSIVSCQMGFGPIETYWSDGSVTGYSDYCQSIQSQNLEEERLANTPSCDGITCRYPNGAEFPDPNAAPQEVVTEVPESNAR